MTHLPRAALRHWFQFPTPPRATGFGEYRYVSLEKRSTTARVSGSAPSSQTITSSDTCAVCAAMLASVSASIVGLSKAGTAIVIRGDSALWYLGHCGAW